MGSIIGRSKRNNTKEGREIAEIIDYIEVGNVKTKFGFQDRVTMVFGLPNGKTHNQSYNAVTHEESNFGKLIRSLLKEIDEDNFHIDDLLGIRCEITIEKHVTKDGRVFYNVVKAEPIEESAQESINSEDAEKIFNDEEAAS